MDFETFASHELSDLARRLSEAAARQTDVATTKAAAAYQASIDKLRDDYQQLTAENERLSAERAAWLLEKTTLLESARRQDRKPLLERLLAVFERIDRSPTVEEVLAAAADGFADDFSRIVVLRAEDGRLTVDLQRGRLQAAPLAPPAAGLNGGSWLAHAARMQSVRVFDPQTKATGDTPFGGQPSLIVTAPIAVHGQLQALLYADDEGLSDSALGSDSALRLAGVLQRHTALRLERLTIELKAIAELRAYAQMLLDEVEYVHAADLTAKKTPQEQSTRLAENLRCARQIFQQRVTLEGPAAASLLEEALAKTLAAKAGTPFGAHLADAAAVPAVQVPV